MRSIALTLCAFAVGALFMIAAAYIGILSYESCWTGGTLVSCSDAPEIRKEVGFLLAINWSVGLLFLFPAFIFCVSQTYEQAKDAIRVMATRQMIVTDTWALASEANLLRVLRRQAIFMLVVVIVLLTIAALFLGWDFVRVVLDFYDHPQSMANLPLTHPELEVDWSVAATACRFLEGAACRFADWQYTANVVFAAAAYVYLTWFGAVMAVGFMVAVLLLATSFMIGDFAARKLFLVPDVTSSDRRRGLEVFEGFFTCALAGCFVLFAMGYLVTLQNIYLRSTAINLPLFVAPYIVVGEGFSWSGLFLGIEAAVSGKLGLINANVGAVTILGMLFFAIVIAAVVFVLRYTAQRGRRRFLDALKSPDPTVQAQLSAYLLRKGATTKGAGNALNNFVLWPIRWVRLNWLALWLAIATVSLFAVTIGFYIIGLGLTYVVWVAARPLLNSSQATPPPGQGKKKKLA